MFTEQRREARAGKQDIPVKTRRPAASSGTIPRCELPGDTTPSLPLLRLCFCTISTELVFTTFSNSSDHSPHITLTFLDSGDGLDHSQILHAGIVPDDAAGRRVFSGISRFPRTFIPVLLHVHLTSRSSALKTSMSRAAKYLPSLGGDPQIRDHAVEFNGSYIRLERCEREQVFLRLQLRRNSRSRFPRTATLLRKSGSAGVISRHEYEGGKYGELGIDDKVQECITEDGMEQDEVEGGLEGERKIPKKIRRPTASSGMIPICENPGIESGSRWLEANRLNRGPLAYGNCDGLKVKAALKVLLNCVLPVANPREQSTTIIHLRTSTSVVAGTVLLQSRNAPLARLSCFRCHENQQFAATCVAQPGNASKLHTSAQGIIMSPLAAAKGSLFGTADKSVPRVVTFARQALVISSTTAGSVIETKTNERSTSSSVHESGRAVADMAAGRTVEIISTRRCPSHSKEDDSWPYVVGVLLSVTSLRYQFVGAPADRCETSREREKKKREREIDVLRSAYSSFILGRKKEQYVTSAYAPVGGGALVSWVRAATALYLGHLLEALHLLPCELPHRADVRLRHGVRHHGRENFLVQKIGWEFCLWAEGLSHRRFQEPVILAATTSWTAARLLSKRERFQPTATVIGHIMISVFYPIKVPAHLKLVSASEAINKGSNKGYSATRIKCAIATKHTVL
ncbi:hypothetical protein PR048_002173 [Dryococelus australis]|uniref:Uncharacterized protein n=1 Tax=Dryococelus australis TaxID=614101 RepID=A0ABQ9IK69_9NEOP|nr:hypothetical protein PR048_002173 [Dryococelus australis]